MKAGSAESLPAFFAFSLHSDTVFLHYTNQAYTGAFLTGTAWSSPRSRAIRYGAGL